MARNETKKEFYHAEWNPSSEPDELEEGSQENWGKWEGSKGEWEWESPGWEGLGEVGQQFVQLPAYARLTNL